ncbi:MAG: hypothetical protein ACFFCQ_04120 [Promethearchaeota archaeon]
MPMLLHEEIVARYLIPAIKREMSEELAIRDYKQTEIAKILHVTPAAITHYLKQKRAQRVHFPPKLRREIRLSINNLIEDKEKPITPSFLRQELIRIIDMARCEKILCELHKELDSSAPEDCCDLCRRQDNCQNY